MGPIIIIVVLALLGWLAVSASLPPTVAWIVAVGLAALSLLLIVGNPVAGLIAQRRKKNYSFVPFFGGVFGALSLLFCPIHGARYFAWVPLILDLTIPMFLYAVFVLGAFRTHPKNDDRGEFDTKTRNCPNCGRENSIFIRVCPRCSTKLDANACDEATIRIRARVIGCLRQGFLEILVGAGYGMLDGGVPTEIPLDIVPQALHSPIRSSLSSKTENKVRSLPWNQCKERDDFHEDRDDPQGDLLERRDLCLLGRVLCHVLGFSSSGPRDNRNLQSER